MSTRIVVGGMTVVAVALFIGYYFYQSVTPGQYDEFAQCLGEKDTTFYGAFWCPHCQEQEDLFGKSEKYLPYVECSTPNGQGQLQVCVDAGIGSYPTWEFADGSRLNGVVSLEVLAEKTGCELPQ